MIKKIIIFVLKVVLIPVSFIGIALVCISTVFMFPVVIVYKMQGRDYFKELQGLTTIFNKGKMHTFEQDFKDLEDGILFDLTNEQIRKYMKEGKSKNGKIRN